VLPLCARATSRGFEIFAVLGRPGGLLDAGRLALIVARWTSISPRSSPLSVDIKRHDREHETSQVHLPSPIATPKPKDSSALISEVASHTSDEFTAASH
jgi:hypothetical protein